MGTRDSHPQSSGAPHVWLARHRIIRKAAEIPSTTAERFENSCCSLRASRNANNRFCDAAFAATKPICTRHRGVWLSRGHSHLRISDCFDRCWIFECGRIAKIFAEVSGPDDPAHHFCVPSLWDVVDKNNFARHERFAEVPSYALL